MKFAIRLLVGITVALSVACSGGGGSGGSGDMGGAAAATAVFPSNGSYEGIGTFVTNIRVVDLLANTPPVSDDCVGDISIVVDDSQADVLTGSGQCLTAANSATYQLVGGFLNDNDFEGVITITFSRVDHVLDFSGTRNGNVLEATFADRTPQTSRIVIDWDGSFSAARP
jgi:hypothetical protein